jgi:cell division protein FtsA
MITVFYKLTYLYFNKHLMSKLGKIAVLDIASRKVVCVIANVNGDGVPRIIGFGHQVSEGVKAGIIIDIKKAERSILSALNSAEKMAGETVDEAYVNISGSNITSNHINIETKISGHEVTFKDIDLMLSKGNELFENKEVEIIQTVPCGYRIDDSEGIKDPIGMFGQVISTNLHVVTASATAVRNIKNCLAKCHVNVRDFVVSSYASGLSTLSDDEKEIGVTVLDIGAGNTSIAIFSEGYPVYFDSVPLGGLHITKDIALGLSVGIPFAERLKVIHGSAVATDTDDLDRIDLTDENEGFSLNAKQATKAELTAIIKPRVEEILEMAKSNLEKSGLYGVSGNKIVITGGSAQLQGMKEISSYIFNKHVRIARPIELPGIPESAKGAAFSTAIGMILHAAKNREIVEAKTKFNPMEMVSSKKSNSQKSNKIVEWFKKNF